MNRYPAWKYAIIVVALLFGVLYTLPNFFSLVPAVQIASAKATIKVDPTLVQRIGDILKQNQITQTGIFFQEGLAPSIRVRLTDDDAQRRAKDVLQKELNPDPTDPLYVVALNRLSSTPNWLSWIAAKPMYLGLDLSGGVHFLMQVDLNAAVNKRLDALVQDVRGRLREKNVRSNGSQRNGSTVEVSVADAATANQALPVLEDSFSDFNWRIVPDGSAMKLVGVFKPLALRTIQENAIKQNINTLHNRVNQLGTSEPVIQQQGADRIVVELPGVQDTARAKDIIGRTATLEARMVDSSADTLAAAANGTVPFGDDKFTDPQGVPLFVHKDVVFSGDDLTDAEPNVDQTTQAPVVNLVLDDKGARVVRDVSRDNIGKRMALVLFEKGKGSIITAPVIRGELGARFQISGGDMTPESAADIALLLRSGSLAAPMDIIEERVVGPSLGRDNINRGFLSTIYGFAAITVFMVLYYVLFGLVSVVALGTNLLLLVAVLSVVQATLTLPGMAAIALTLGMAIDSNVLINERIREELRNGTPPQAAIAAGYERAFGTILDSNITTLIAGLSLWAFGQGPVRGFAVVHCLGITTSIFSSVFVSRGVVNLIYGRRKKLASLAIGQVWKPA